MAPLLFVAFLVVPIVELYVIVQVSQGIGAGSTILALIAVSVVGAWLVKHEGLGLLRRIQRQVQRGEMPTNELIDGALILFAGALMLTPGFVTDGFGVLLLLPPSRAVVRTGLRRRFRDHLVIHRFGGPSTGRSNVWDAESWEEPAAGHERRELP